ncbi:unnamed protein product, partial [Discosporangium mesarthrocarpum]
MLNTIPSCSTSKKSSSPSPSRASRLGKLLSSVMFGVVLPSQVAGFTYPGRAFRVVRLDGLPCWKPPPMRFELGTRIRPRRYGFAPCTRKLFGSPNRPIGRAEISHPLPVSLLAVEAATHGHPHRALGCRRFLGVESSRCETADDVLDAEAPQEKSIEVVLTEALRVNCGVRGGDVVLVLTSGGCDSVALLLALTEARNAFHPPIRVEACHFNHGLRAAESDEDEAFVVNLAARLRVPCHVRRWQNAGGGGNGLGGKDGGGREDSGTQIGMVKAPMTGIQEKARDWRRQESQSILQDLISQRKVRSDEAEEGVGGRGEESPQGHIAMAHHRDDQMETILLKALRGVHITNIQGMAWEAHPFIRPLLGVSKEELKAYLLARGQGWRDDESNATTKYRRNRVRLQLLPLLNELVGGESALQARFNEITRQSALAQEMVDAEAN